MKLRKGEEVWFSFIVYKSRRDRDRILKRVISEPQLQGFDPTKIMGGKRLFWGGFKVVVAT